MSEDNKQFVDGIHASEAKPSFVLAKIGVKVDKFIKFIKEQEDERGWVNIDIKKSKGGNVYAELNTFSGNKTRSDQPDISDGDAKGIPTDV